MYCLHHQGENVFLHSVLWLLVTANIPSLLILVTLMVETIRSSKMLVVARATWHNITDGIHGIAKLKSYTLPRRNHIPAEMIQA
jgi:hypothetical protein